MASPDDPMLASVILTLETIRNASALATTLIDKGNILEASLITSEITEACDKNLPLFQQYLKIKDEDNG